MLAEVIRQPIDSSYDKLVAWTAAAETNLSATDTSTIVDLDGKAVASEITSVKKGISLIGNMFALIQRGSH